MKDNKYYDGTMYPKSLKLQEQLDFINKYYGNNDKDARKKLIEHNVRLVIHIVNKRFCHSSIEVEELFEVGVIGLIKGVDTFDPNKGFQFATYVSKCITNEILMTFRKENKNAKTVSLDDCINVDDSGNELSLKDIIKDEKNLPEDNYADKETCYEIKEIIDSLPERDKQIIIMYFGFGGKRYTQKQISEYLGISQSYVSRILKRNIEKIGIKLKEKMFNCTPRINVSIDNCNIKTSMQTVNNTDVYNYLINLILNKNIKSVNVKIAQLMYLRYKYEIYDNKMLASLLNVNEKKVNIMLIEGLNLLKNMLSCYIKFDNGYVYTKK